MYNLGVALRAIDSNLSFRMVPLYFAEELAKATSAVLPMKMHLSTLFIFYKKVVYKKVRLKFQKK